MNDGSHIPPFLEIIDLEYLGEYKFEVLFNNGQKKHVNLKKLIENPPPVFEPLKKEENFSSIKINPVGGVCWDCGADLSAEYIRDC